MITRFLNAAAILMCRPPVFPPTKMNGFEVQTRGLSSLSALAKGAREQPERKQGSPLPPLLENARCAQRSLDPDHHVEACGRSKII